MKQLLQSRGLIYFVVILMVAITACVSYPWHADLWTNLFANAIGVAVTVFIIEALISYGESRRTRPARFAAFREALLIYGRFSALWMTMVQKSFDPVRDKHTMQDEKITLFDVRFGDIIAHINLDNEAPVIPKRTWRTHIYEQVGELEMRIDRCLQRYSVFMEPELIKILQDFERTSLMTYGKLITSLPIVDAQLGINRGSYFGWGANSTAEDSIRSALNLGQFLAQLLPQFKGLPGVPTVIDLNHQGIVDDLRKKSSVK